MLVPYRGESYLTFTAFTTCTDNDNVKGNIVLLNLIKK